MKDSNPWDLLSTYFDTTQNEEDIPSGAADNILIAWPVILNFIEQYFPLKKDVRALDYGCGAGSFANKLHRLGFEVSAIDSSKEMIQKARSAYGKYIKFYADTSLTNQKNSFSLITSIMTLQFIKDIKKTFEALASSLIENRYLIFAVHNPDYIKGNILKFENGIEVPVYIRTAKEYNSLAKKYNLQPLLEQYPPFTKEFIEKYPEYKEEKVPEYLILGYKKNTPYELPSSKLTVHPSFPRAITR